VTLIPRWTIIGDVEGDDAAVLAVRVPTDIEDGIVAPWAWFPVIEVFWEEPPDPAVFEHVPGAC